MLFLGQLACTVDQLVLVGRLNPEEGRFERLHYRVADEIEFVPLPHYESLAGRGRRPGMAGSAKVFGRVLDEVDVVWLGVRTRSLHVRRSRRCAGKRIVLGVRQDFPEHARTRHPDRRIHSAADVLEAPSACWAGSARRSWSGRSPPVSGR